MVITDNLIEISLPYLVYKIKTIIATIPMERKIQARTYKNNEGPKNASSGGTSGSVGSNWLGMIK